jgi:hypothetical protein
MKDILDAYSYVLDEKKKKKSLPSDPAVLPTDIDTEELELVEKRMSAAAVELLDVLRTLPKTKHSLSDLSSRMNPRTHFKKIQRGAEILQANGLVDYDGAAYVTLTENVGRDFGIGYRNEIVQFFTKNPYPDDMQVHEFATSMGISPEDMEREIYALLTDLLQNNESKQVNEMDFDNLTTKIISLAWEHGWESAARYADMIPNNEEKKRWKAFQGILKRL